VQVEPLDARLNVILTLLLTEIAFKFIIAESIPKASAPSAVPHKMFLKSVCWS
jgi:hypothetical protein